MAVIKLHGLFITLPQNYDTSLLAVNSTSTRKRMAEHRNDHMFAIM